MDKFVVDAVITDDGYLSYKIMHGGKLFLRDESTDAASKSIDVSVMDIILDLQYFGNLPLCCGIKRRDDMSDSKHARYWLYYRA